MRKNKHRHASLKKVQNYDTKPDTTMQSGPRTAIGHTLNYSSVNTLDPSRLASAFTLADQGLITHQAALFELVEEQDAHIFSELSKRKRAITSLGWQLTARDDATAAELARTAELEDMIRNIDNIEDAQYDLADGIAKGFSTLEVEWKLGDVWLPKMLHYVPQRHFVLDNKTRDLQYNGTGIPEALRPNGWIVHEHKSKSGYMEQSALFRVLAWTYAYKAYNIKDMQRFLELYGLPLRLGKYPAGIDKASRDQLLKAVRAIGNDGAGVIPANMMIEFVQSTAKGNISDFLSTIEYWEHKQSKAILGGEPDGKTMSEARITLFDKVRREILLHDVGQLQPTLTRQLIAPINDYNGMFKPDRMPQWSYLTQESVDQQKMITVLQTGVELGMKIEVEYAHEILQIPIAKDGATILGKVSKDKNAIDDKSKKDDTNQQELSASNILGKLASLAAQQGAEAHLTDAYTAQLAALGAKHEAQLVQKVAAVVAEAGDFDQAIEGIEALAVDFKVPALTEVIALGMAAAHLGGMSEVQGD
ncbi:MAG: DUF935 domain-containing protein [Methylophilus sp.]